VEGGGSYEGKDYPFVERGNTVRGEKRGRKGDESLFFFSGGEIHSSIRKESEQGGRGKRTFTSLSKGKEEEILRI